MDITVDTSQMSELAEFWRLAPRLTKRELTRTVTEIDLLVQGELQQGLPRGTGGVHGAGLVGSIHRTERVLADNVIGMVATSEPYAVDVEMGTRPHMPPIQPLKDWVEAKLGIRDDDEATGVAYAIAHKIAKHGTAPNPVWKETYERLLPTMQRKVQDALTRLRNRLAEGTP